MLEFENVQVGTVLLDSVPTTNSGILFTGAVEDPVTGTTSATGYFRIEPGSVGAALKDNVNPDSVKVEISLPYQYVYGDTSQNISFHVVPLTQGLDDEKTYYNRDALPYDVATAWETITFKPDLSAGVLKFNLNKLGTEVLAKGGNTVLASSTAFLAQFKGFALVPNGQNKGLVGFELRDSPTAIMYYKTRTAPLVREFYAFKLNNSVRHFNQITGNRAGTALSSLQNTGDTLSAVQANNRGYLQSGTGIRGLVKFPGLERLRETIGTASIARAELEIKHLEQDGKFLPPLNLSLVETDRTNRMLRDGNSIERVILNDLSLSQGAAGYTFPYSSIDKGYKLGITTYVSRVVNGTLPNSGLVVTPASASFAVNRLVFGNGGNTTPAAERTRLRIYYLPATAGQ